MKLPYCKCGHTKGSHNNVDIEYGYCQGNCEICKCESYDEKGVW